MLIINYRGNLIKYSELSAILLSGPLSSSVDTSVQFLFKSGEKANFPISSREEYVLFIDAFKTALCDSYESIFEWYGPPTNSELE